jgi:hypothetical protein
VHTCIGWYPPPPPCMHCQWEHTSPGPQPPSTPRMPTHTQRLQRGCIIPLQLTGKAMASWSLLCDRKARWVWMLVVVRVCMQQQQQHHEGRF